MFFNGDKKIGRNLALIAIKYPDQQIEQIKKEAIFNRQFSEIEVFRLSFCLMISNLSSLIWWVNHLERNKNRAKKILNSVTETFLSLCETLKDPVRIGDLIVDPSEITLINNEMGQIGVNKNTMTSCRTIMPIIYNNRMVQYFNAFNERVFEKKQFSLDPVAQLFVKHFIGDEWGKHIDLVIELTAMLGAFDIAISDTVKEMLRSKQTKVKQENAINSRFKNREEYEVWEAGKIKENEEKRQQSLRDEEGNINHYYEILELKPDATKEKIKQAYKDLLTVWNPDEFTDEPDLQQKAREKVKEIDEAYEKLMLHLSNSHKQTTRIQPDDVDGYYNLGVKYEKLDMYEEAIEAYKRAIMIKPDYAKANYGLGVAYLYSGQKSKALEQYQKLKKLNPNLAEELFKQIYK